MTDEAASQLSCRELRTAPEAVPASIDRVGRLNEWLVAVRLNKVAGKPAEASECRLVADGLRPDLSLVEQKRAEVAADKIASRVLAQLRGQRIASVVPVGEKNKKRGAPDFDILVELSDGTKTGYSLKLQTSPTGVNVRNPTANSLLEQVTGTGFDARLTPDEAREYRRLGEDYQSGKVQSRQLGTWGAREIATHLTQAYTAAPTVFASRLHRQLRADTNLILAVVDENARFLGFVTSYPESVRRLATDPSGLAFVPEGISVHILIRDRRVGHIDVFMMSSSAGLGRKLRCVIRLDFEMEPTG